MGVPAFYKWLAEKYPLVVVDVVMEEPVVIDDISIPVDTTKPNPNEMEFDNLYLDMNNIIHPCFHPESGDAPSTFDEVFQAIFDYIDKLFVMVRPRKILYMAIDGVAPRAKMNQQRSRRFRAAKEAAVVAAEEQRLREEFEREGRKLPPKVKSEVFDSNIITPGTEFMSVLSVALQYYTHLRLNYDPGWKNIKVILSDSNVPGEGEHKIMSYIRHQRNLPGYDPNTRHCLYGLDADLIMLAMTTHEVHFSILREVIHNKQTLRKYGKCFQCGQSGHIAAQCQAPVKRKAESQGAVRGDEYQFLNIWTLRDYLAEEMLIPDPPFEIDVDRVIDDFVFMCFFVGNDFLPNMPTLELREGAINLLMTVYKKNFTSMGGYLTDGSKLDLGRVEQFIQVVGSHENEIFKRRSRERKVMLNKMKHDRRRTTRTQKSYPLTVVGESDVNMANGRPQKVSRLSSGANVSDAIIETEKSLESELNENQEELKTRLQELLKKKSDSFITDDADVVKLGTPKWRERYYKAKFSAETPEELEEIRKELVLKYTEGLCWVMHYYYEGVCSWRWFFPYHYAPFASDLKDLRQLDISFELGSPFKPFNQLLGVFPAASCHALPEHYRKLMNDPDSPIIDFYPTEFEVDMNGKHCEWQGVAKLPFIDEHRLLAEVAKVEHTLTEEEARRNSVMPDMLFVATSHPLSEHILSLDQRCKQVNESKHTEVKEKINPELSGGMNGYISLHAGITHSPIFRSPIKGMTDILANQVICGVYILPDFHKHIGRPPAGVKLPPKGFFKGWKHEFSLWHESSGKKSWQNDRKNPVGSISGSKLAEASLRVVMESMLENYALCLPIPALTHEAK